MTNRSMLDVAYDVLSSRKTEISFLDLWTEIVKTLGFTPAQSEQKIAQFYSAIMLDVRFAQLNDNLWDLRSRRTYNETHVDTSTILVEDEYLSDDEVEEILVSEDEEIETTEDEEEE